MLLCYYRETTIIQDKSIWWLTEEEEFEEEEEGNVKGTATVRRGRLEKPGPADLGLSHENRFSTS